MSSSRSAGLERLAAKASEIAHELGIQLYGTEWSAGGKGDRLTIHVHPEHFRSARAEFTPAEVDSIGAGDDPSLAARLGRRIEDALKIALDKLAIREGRLGGAKRLHGE